MQSITSAKAPCRSRMLSSHPPSGSSYDGFGTSVGFDLRYTKSPSAVSVMLSISAARCSAWRLRPRTACCRGGGTRAVWRRPHADSDGHRLPETTVVSLSRLISFLQHDSADVTQLWARASVARSTCRRRTRPRFGHPPRQVGRALPIDGGRTHRCELRHLFATAVASISPRKLGKGG